MGGELKRLKEEEDTCRTSTAGRLRAGHSSSMSSMIQKTLIEAEVELSGTVELRE